MALDIKLPELGEGVDEAEVLDVLVAAGDKVEPEQDIIEVETDKTSAAVPCTQAGRVARVHVEAGDTIHVGDVLVTLDDPEDEKTSMTPTAARFLKRAEDIPPSAHPLADGSLKESSLP